MNKLNLLTAIVSYSLVSLLNAQELSLRDHELLKTEYGQQQLKYLISCALPKGLTVNAKTSTGKTLTFEGDAGLAGGWLKRGLTLKEEQLVSSCMLARTNFYGKHVMLSMASKGKNAPDYFGRTTQEKQDFPIYEAGFFGNIFKERPIQYVCIGNNHKNRTKLLEKLYRVCSLPETSTWSRCGFKIVGSCENKPFIQKGVDYSQSVIDVYLSETKSPMD